MAYGGVCIFSEIGVFSKREFDQIKGQQEARDLSQNIFLWLAQICFFWNDIKILIILTTYYGLWNTQFSFQNLKRTDVYFALISCKFFYRSFKPNLFLTSITSFDMNNILRTLKPADKSDINFRNILIQNSIRQLHAVSFNQHIFMDLILNRFQFKLFIFISVNDSKFWKDIDILIKWYNIQ